MLCPHNRTTIDMIELHCHLKAARWHGARGPRLAAHVPAIVEQLYPADWFPGVSEQERALRIQRDITHVIAHDIGGPPGDALAALLGLRAGTTGRKLGERRRLAGEHLDIDGATFKKPRHEEALLLDLAAALCNYYIHTAPSSTEIEGDTAS